MGAALKSKKQNKTKHTHTHTKTPQNQKKKKKPQTAEDLGSNSAKLHDFKTQRLIWIWVV